MDGLYLTISPKGLSAPFPFSPYNEHLNAWDINNINK